MKTHLRADVVCNLDPNHLASWLRANRWNLKEAQDSKAIYVKSAPDNDEYVIDLPLQKDFKDYARRMTEVLDTVVIASQKSATEVLAEVRASAFDIVRFRATGASVNQGRIPIDLGVQFFAYTRELMLSAACSVIDPRPVYRSRKPNEAIDFIKRVKLAAPEEGSFVITVHAQIPPILQLGLAPGLEDISFERKSTLMLARAAQATRQAASHAALGGSAELFLMGASQGISANLCDAIANFVTVDESARLDIQFSWALHQPAPDETPSSVSFGADLSPILKEGARLLRANSSIDNFELIGSVLKLESDKPGEGGIVVIGGDVDGRLRKVRVPMGATDYAVAIDAHKNGQLLKCEGELERKDRRFEIDRVRHVEIFNDDI